MPQPIIVPALCSLPRIRHGFFTRAGGVSTGIYAGLNVGLGSNDERAHVLENRRRVAGHLGAEVTRLVTAHQVHSAKALVIDAPCNGDLPRVDALVTRTSGLAVGALAADCCPVLFADGDAGVVAAAHAGWRGALGGVLEATIEAMESIGAERGRIVAVVGPTISQQAYEVGPEFEAEFLAHESTAHRYFARATPEARPHFDLPGYVCGRLGQSGVQRYESAARCTYANESEFFSYRRATHRGEGDYGRQISAIVVA